MNSQNRLSNCIEAPRKETKLTSGW